MRTYKGKSVFGGIAIGRIWVTGRDEKQVRPTETGDAEGEIRRYRQAAEKAVIQLKELHERALREVGEEGAAIFEIHQMMLEDGDYRESIERAICVQKVNAEYAVARTGDSFAQMFASMEDAYMRERATDVRDITRRLLGVLRGGEEERHNFTEPVVIVAEDLTPSELVRLDRNKVLAFVTTQGSLYSHTAILARTMGIPALVDTRLPLDDALDQKACIVDGTDGTFYVEPDGETLDRMRRARQEELQKEEPLHSLRGRENITLDGQKILLCANIGSREELAAALSNDADGIGLFRSELIYLASGDLPTEEEQFRIYRDAAQAMGGKRVIIRTLDIGADKQCGYLHMEEEQNPAMGHRAIRFCLDQPEIFKTQLRALFRASAYGNIAIMYPMIASVWEIRRIREITEEVRTRLRARGIACGEPEQGIMIETPAAAIISDLLAKEVDFFSIGTNDLTQFVLAADRQNAALDAFCDSRHPAVLRLIEQVVENAHRAGIWAGICGELGGDAELIRDFLAMGVDELSVSPGRILPLRRIVLQTDVSRYRENWQKNWQ